MAYFDSQKNRALWEIELQTLRKLRAERAAGVTGKEEMPVLSGQKSAREPLRMTYQELLKEEAAAVRKTPVRERPAPERSKQLRKEARGYEMG